jgi:hypothetical protein
MLCAPRLKPVVRFRDLETEWLVQRVHGCGHPVRELSPYYKTEPLPSGCPLSLYNSYTCSPSTRVSSWVGCYPKLQVPSWSLSSSSSLFFFFTFLFRQAKHPKDSTPFDRRSSWSASKVQFVF